MKNNFGTVLSKKEIARLIKQNPPLVEGFFNLEQQLQPNGMDFTLREVALLQSSGMIASANSGRRIPGLAPLAFDSAGFLELVPGPYIITVNEIVNLPRNIMALAWPRSSLLRCGVSINNAVWDAGYSGRSQCLMVVHNPQGFSLQRNARILQLVFLQLSGDTEAYNGIYQGENIA